MLLIKRILANLINGAFLLIGIIILGFVLKKFRIELEHTYFLFLLFSIVYFIPIIILKTNIGLKIMRVTVSSVKRLFLKYTIYYFIFSGCCSSLLHLVSDITSFRSIFVFSFRSIYVGFGIIASIFLINTMLLFASGGKYNLVDYIIKLSYDNTVIKHNEILTLSIWMSSIMFPIITFALIQQIFIYPENQKFPNVGKKITESLYFPREIFDEYSYNELEAFERTNEFITPMVYESFFSETTVKKRTLYSVINKSTFNSPLKRYELCLLLRRYSMITAKINLDEIDDTEIYLIYRAPHTYYSNITYTYRYYVNDKYEVNGGIDLDSLNAHYKRSITIFAESLAKATQKSVDSILVGDAYTLTEEQRDRFIDDYISQMRHNSNLTNIKSFNAVKPLRVYATNFPQHPPHMIELTNPYNGNDYIESINLRNYAAVLANVFQYVSYTKYVNEPNRINVVN